MLDTVLLELAAQLPLLIVYVAGIILALVKRRYYPRATTFLLVAVGLSLAIQIFSTAFYTLAPGYLMHAGVDMITYGYYAYAVSITSNLGHAAAFGFLLAAIFARQTPRIEQS